ncbi:MAG: hypothetical protein H0U54_19400 [Acidobacteria bacterium]|nr:hypothetical protein [Acidobacteriota bacterium]
MSSWMKRRIDRSRARCRRALLESKEARRTQSKPETNTQVAPGFRVKSHPASDK